MGVSFSTLIDRFGIADFAREVGVSYGAAKQMRRRNSIAPEYWPQVIAASRQRGWTDVSADALMCAAANERTPELADTG